MTSRRKNRFTSQPDSRNSTASQSSSSGCEGNSPLTPKSPAVRTRPVPNTSCQKRFTVTRAVSGCSGRSSHSARPSRFRGKSAGIGGRKPGVPGVDLVAALVVLAAEQHIGHRPARAAPASRGPPCRAP